MTESQTPLKPLHPTLYELAEDGRSLNFFFAQCSACNELSFPANAPGCVHCGEPLSDARKLTLPGGGELLEFVTLHVALVPGMAVPSIAGDVRIARGIIEEGVIAVPDEKVLKPGMALKAVAEIREVGGIYGCRFVPADAEVAQ
ncbi:hypothetical protein [Cupriavidus sp. UME77]|uniref:zinc ribbon domain-containing protein n=1 Tax=Cupriavidus sp. UME77 TaxID=1862321 RepID=UPI001D4F7D30|nr:hypothetical protein [Cupriavidus sp. UME77]MBB1633422.1 hypothetical protein [Cupriavidus sp. UME77]